jgi:choline dehydrogenase-like flavoprotein
VIIDARTLASGGTIEVDLCVIGGGAAGITIARTLIGSSLSVLVLESGGFDQEPETTTLSEGEIVGDPIRDYFSIQTLQQARARAFGGTTHKWGGFCRPLTPIDFETRPYQTVAGWPFGRAELDPWYEQAQAICQLGPYNYDASWWASQLGTPAPMNLGSTVTTGLIQKNPTRFGTVHRPAIQAASNVIVLHHANVTNIAATPGGDHVDHLVVRTLSGVQGTVRASAYVLATGGIEVPRLLLASNDVVPTGLGNSSGTVGRYFADHNQVVASFAPLTVSPGELYHTATASAPYPTPENPNNRVYAQGVIDLAESTMRSEALPHLHMETFVEDGAYRPTQDTGISANEIADLFKAEARPMPKILGATIFFEPVLIPTSRVTLSPTSTDALGMPRVQLDHHRAPVDQDHLARGAQILAQALGESGLGRLQTASGWVTQELNPPSPPPPGHLLPYLRVTPQGNTPANVPFGTTYHHMCTTRMDLDPAQGVVDIDCRMHDVDNLYIGGSAVFPTSPGSHPTLTIVALALRLAAHLLDELEGS